MHAFTVHPQRKSPAPADAPPRRRWRRVAAVALLLLGVAGAVWAARPHSRFVQAQELQKKLADAKSLPPDQRKALFTEYRDQMKHLTADQKWELSAPMRAKASAELDRYVALSPRERVKYLDAKIDESEKRRKEREQKGGPGRPTGAGGPPGGAAFVNAGGGGRPNGGGPGGPGGAGGPGGRSPEQIAQRRKEMLDRTSPEERAKRDLFRKEMNDRRKQRGLPVTGRA